MNTKEPGVPPFWMTDIHNLMAKIDNTVNMTIKTTSHFGPGTMLFLRDVWGCHLRYIGDWESEFFVLPVAMLASCYRE